MRGNATTELSIGDQVRVLGQVSNERSLRNLSYLEEMNDYVGVAGEVKKILSSEGFVQVSGAGAFWWAPEWLDIDPDFEDCPQEKLETINDILSVLF